MVAHLNPHSSDFWYPCALYSPCWRQLTRQSSLFERGCPVLVVVCVARKLHPCPSYSRRRDRINLGLWRSLYKGGGGYSLGQEAPGASPFWGTEPRTIGQSTRSSYLPLPLKSLPPKCQTPTPPPKGKGASQQLTTTAEGGDPTPPTHTLGPPTHPRPLKDWAKFSFS